MNEQIIWIILKRLRTPFFILIATFSVSILGLVLIPGVDNNGHVYHMTFFDAFYFVSYMASTIGFGEAPYSFNYEQRIWVSFAIYFTVIGWFYGIGAIVSLMQDESLKKAISRNRFRRQVKRLHTPFYIILGYNSITKSIIEKINGEDYRVVVLEKREDKIDELILENFYPNVPAFVGDATNQQMLKIAGIHHKNCVGLISLFENDMVNSQIATIAKILNKKIDVIVKATSPQQVKHFESMGLKNVKNPFDIISTRIFYGITAPHIWLLEMWVYGHILKLKQRDRFPKGRYIVYGYGRMGHAIKEGLEKANIEYVTQDLDTEEFIQRKNTTIFGDDEDMQSLLDLGIKESDCIIAATKDDLLNLSILNSAKQLNPDIFTIARENSLDDLNIFKAAKVNKIYVVEKLLADVTYNYIARPLADLFIIESRKKDEEWAKIIVNMLNNITGMNPMYFETKIDEEHAYALSLKLNDNQAVTLADVRRSRSDRNEFLHIAYLLLKRGKETYLMPDSQMQLQIGDELLIVADEETYDDFEYILNNIYELEYVLGFTQEGTK